MRMRLPAMVALTLSLALPARAQQQFQIYAQVADSSGNPPSTLETTDFRVSESGAPAKVVKVESITRSVKLQLLVDNGLGSQNLGTLREGLRSLLEALPEGLETTLVTTAPQPRFLVRATTDKKALLDGLGRLSPDSGAGRFVESLLEATQRTERDKAEHLSVIVMVGTTRGDADLREGDVNRIFDRIRKFPTIVHVVLLSSTQSDGGAQTQLGVAVTKGTGGRYENIAAASRLATLLPELGKLVADTSAKQAQQFRLTIERPASAKGDLGQISATLDKSGLALTGLSMNGAP